MADQTGNVELRPAEQSNGGGVGSWIAGMFVDPKGAFESIASRTHMPHPKDPNKTKDRTRWLIPVIIMTVVVLIMIVMVIVPYVAGPAQEEAVRTAIMDRGGTEAQVEQAMAQAGAFMLPASIVGGIFQVVIMVFIIAGLVHLLMKMLGCKGTFRHARAIVAYSMLVSTAGTLIKLPFMKMKETMFVETGLAIFFKNLEPSDKLYRILFTGFDVFTIWWIIVLGIGMAVAYKASKGKAITAAVIVWLLTTVMGMFGPGGA
jgi:hypothetical protein